ncbi:MAG: DUF1697 domain-containing protein [Thermoleophilia bacterium]|nr:DUF1697 domain-containing protein [Thermoleophilia bacterium]
MDRYVAFLRGMNLGNRRIKNPELTAEFEDLGLLEVATFRASGNVIFGVEKKEARAKLTARVEAGLREGLGYDVPVYVRSVDEVAVIAAHEPFPAKALAASKGKLQVTMLPKKPTAAARKKVLALGSDEDRLAIEGSELYWLPSGGTIDSDLDLKTIARVLGPGTQRTMGTIEQIAAKYCG